MGELILQQGKLEGARSFLVAPKLEIEVPGLDLFAFVLPVNAQLDRLIVSLEDVNNLHLSEIDLKIEGEWVSLRDGIVGDCSQSSIMRNDQRFALESWLSRKSAFFCTKKECQPWVNFSLDKIYTIEAIRLLNRRDGLWDRSRKIRIDIETEASDKQCIFDGSSSVSVLSFLHSKLQQLDRELLIPSLGEHAGITFRVLDPALRSRFGFWCFYRYLPRLIGRVASVLEACLERNFETYQQGSEEIWKLCWICMQLVDIPNLALRKVLISALILSGKGRHAFRYFKHTIRDWGDEEVSALESMVARVGEKLDGTPLIIGAHDFSRSLRSYPKDNLFETVIDVLDVCRLDEDVFASMICYGTLLGLYRDGDFIAYDDDIDLLAVVDSCHWGGIEPLCNRIKVELRRRGLTVRETSTNDSSRTPLLQIYSKSHPVNVDLFFGFLARDRIKLPMAKVRYADIPAKLLLPVQKWQYEKYSMDAPADIEGFLESRYGTGWVSPDPLFRANEYKKG
ncbi:LicD family protein [Microbulbifer sp. ARAS458-1]|uniref:LicD family protein n=1 Tax=Microbulbifer sp. ARAS458-1 TaxID=3140242 RepID=UPI003877CD67